MDSRLRGNDGRGGSFEPSRVASALGLDRRLALPNRGAGIQSGNVIPAEAGAGIRTWRRRVRLFTLGSHTRDALHLARRSGHVLEFRQPAQQKMLAPGGTGVQEFYGRTAFVADPEPCRPFGAARRIAVLAVTVSRAGAF